MDEHGGWRQRIERSGGLSKGTQGHVDSRELIKAMVIEGNTGKERARHGRNKPPQKSTKNKPKANRTRACEGRK